MNDSPHPSPSAVRASQEVRTVIGRLRRRILNAAEAEDLTFGQQSVLTRLSDRQGVTASDLASAEGVRHQSMTATVASLSALGLVERRPDPDDGRRLLIALTAEGHQRVAKGRQARQEWLAAELEQRCTEEERQAVLAAMVILERLTHD
ncbi:MarR family winged helix-turn-helix transcriptional regulator [Actinacidiphila sp. ITFR-21]|uniref:MarR family winged helix-turn-helix transcriptional regulator n=1 Tax=Actinacidiphila sp. ITFR-21 TaxID=3075199 RepID=UPI002889C301|nr:MarR family transcriptional regulator [Streptomyces sp. ITFR-21]WNI16022.1 MarR family transcriptional regulator [Streptomyces sp. ITFR-21]